MSISEKKNPRTYQAGGFIYGGHVLGFEFNAKSTIPDKFPLRSASQAIGWGAVGCRRRWWAVVFTPHQYSVLYTVRLGPASIQWLMVSQYFGGPR